MHANDCWIVARAEAASPHEARIGRLALLPGPVAAVAGPAPEGGIVHVGVPDVAIEDQVMALRILPQLLAGEAEHGPVGSWNSFGT